MPSLSSALVSSTPSNVPLTSALPYLNPPYIQASDIDLFTDTAAILDYLDLRSIMGWPGGA